MQLRDNKLNNRVVTLLDLWDIFVQRLWVMIMAAILVAGAAFAINRLTFVPKYSSTATLYVLRQDDDSSSGDSASTDFSLALNVINDCTYLLKSHVVVDEVLDTLKLDISYEDLRDSISTSNPDDTRILEVTVEADSPEQAKEIVDTLCEIGQDKITDAMGFQQVNFYEKGTLDSKPSNYTRLLTFALIGVITAIIVYSIFLILFLIDDRIRDDEDIERYFGLSVLGDIPNEERADKKGNAYYKAYGATERKGRRK